jgi:hypothetical protein
MHLSPFSFALLRTPVRSLSDARLSQPAMDAVLEEGLFLASPALWQEWSKAILSGREDRKMDLSIHKYRLRSSTRCTPFGTFAGCCVAEIGEGPTALVLDEPAAHRRHTRIDMNCIQEITEALTRLPVVRQQLKFYPSNSLYALPEDYRYAEYYLKAGTRHYRLSSVRRTAPATAVLEKAVAGATLPELTRLLQEAEGVDGGEAAAFIEEMIRAQVLTSGIEPAITGESPLDALVRNTAGLRGIDGIIKDLKHLQQLLAHPAAGVAYYQSVNTALQALAASFEQAGTTLTIPPQTLQTDLYLSARSPLLEKGLVEAIAAQAEDLQYLARENKAPALEEFKSRFYARYEDAEVPLLLALDADLGVGYAGLGAEHAGEAVLTEDLAAPAAAAGSGTANYCELFALAKYNDYLKRGKAGIVITEEELKSLKKRVAGLHFPAGMYLFGSLLKKDGKLDSAHFIFDLAGLAGPSAAALLGRFTAGDERLAALTREILQDEEATDPNAIYAEIAHLPQARTGNVLLRARLRQHEIPYVGISGADPADQIPADDLMISLRGGRLCLRSKARNRVIVPRLSTAHNYSGSSLPLYRFLCDLQSDGLSRPGAWQWGSLAQLRHLPRVSYKNLVLHKARCISLKKTCRTCRAKRRTMRIG